MGIVNRTLDASQQRSVLPFAQGTPIGTGITVMAALVPSQSVLQAVTVSATGLSGSPTLDLRIFRFIAGAGATMIAGGATTLTAVAAGTSGVQSMVLAASGNSLLNLLANDVLAVITGTSNTAATYAIGFVVQNTQDIKTSLGV